jgi:Flp pilus assembly protein TadG
MTISPATRRKCGLRGSEDGATAVEAAFVLSLLVGMVLTIINFGWAFYIWNALQLVVGQTSRNVIVQNGVPGGSSCYASCAEAALQTTVLRALGATASICTTPTAGEYCVNAICNPVGCSPTTSIPTPTMTLSALYGFNFIGTYTLGGQITVPILPPTPD